MSSRSRVRRGITPQPIRWWEIQNLVRGELNRQIPAKTCINSCIHVFIHVYNHAWPEPVLSSLVGTRLRGFGAQVQPRSEIWPMPLLSLIWGCLNASNNSFFNLVHSTVILLRTENRPEFGALVGLVAPAVSPMSLPGIKARGGYISVQVPPL